ncbi:MAG: S24/S26 family peptidase [Clostridiales bacterium]|nr:S24/S26 family peptidase [Candidatus Coliplasma equi]
MENKLKEVNGVYSVAVASSAMSPMLKPGQDIAVFRKPDREIKELDVLLILTKSGRYLIRRAIRVGAVYILVQGDNDSEAFKITRSEILGIMEKFYRKGQLPHDTNSPSVKLYAKTHTLLRPARKFWRTVTEIEKILSDKPEE